MNVTQLAVAALLVGGGAGMARAQVTPPAEIKDPKLRALQSKHLDQLTSAAAGIVSHKYPAKFYLTRELDLRGAALTAADPRSLEISVFEKANSVAGARKLRRQLSNGNAG